MSSLLFQHRKLKISRMIRQVNRNLVMFQRIRMILAFVMTVAICCFGYKVLKLPQWYIDTEKLNAADPTVITIQGNSITPDYKIINMVRQTQLPYTQIFRLNTKELEENISQLQPVKKVYIRRYWYPARLVIMIDERTPAFLIAPNLESEPNSALTTDGVVIDHDYLPLNPSIRAKKLLTYGVKDGYDEIWDKKKVEEILKLVKAIETYSGREVLYIDLRNRSNIYIMIEDYLIRFGEINDTAMKRAKKIASILPQAKTVKEKIKYIDLRWDETQYFRLEGAKELEKPDSKTQGTKPDEQTQTQLQTDEPIQEQPLDEVERERQNDTRGENMFDE